MCHLYAIGRCDFPQQDWCDTGWHITKHDWGKISENLTAQSKEESRDVRTRGREMTECAEEDTPTAKKSRLLDEIDPKDI